MSDMRFVNNYGFTSGSKHRKIKVSRSQPDAIEQEFLVGRTRPSRMPLERFFGSMSFVCPSSQAVGLVRNLS